jgi:hypothetical protein
LRFAIPKRPQAMTACALPDLMEDALPGTTLAAVNRYSNMAITERARDQFDPKQVELIAHTVADGCNGAELAIFLEECARLELDPFAKQIWAIKVQGKMQIIVSRDGLLLIANRHPDFKGCQSFEIREHDFFMTSTDDVGHVHVQHRWQDSDGNPSHGGKDGLARGEIIGAFAYVRREGHVDTQFMAYRSQYDKGIAVWKTHPSAMMIKVPEGMALRKAYSITGVTVEGELSGDQKVLTAPAGPAVIDFGDDPELAEQIREAMRALGFKHAKARTIMRGADTPEKRQELLSQLQRQLGDEDINEAEIVA